VKRLFLLLLGGCMQPGEFPTCVDRGEDLVFDTVPTWSDDVATIVDEHCASCHRVGGSAPFPIVTYADAAAFAPAIKASVVERRMPPAGPTNCGECQSFTNAPWLSPTEIATIRAWVDGGLPAGTTEAPPEPEPLDATLPRVDQTLAMPAPYTPQGGSDDYRCFVVDAGLVDTTFLTGFSVQAGNPDVVHHVILYGLYAREHQELAAQLERRDQREGFECFGTSGIDDAPMLAAWAPGTPPVVYPEGTGVRLTPGMQLILQVHYHLDEPEPEPDRSRIDLMLAPSVQNEAVLLPVGNWWFELEPGQSSVSDTQVDLDFIGPIGEVELHAVAPHMHTRGRSMQVEVGLGAKRQCLLDVPEWDFEWQGLFFYEEPITVGGGAMLRISCTWDTRDADEVTTWGDGTDDEMCLALFYVTGLPQNRVDAWYSSVVD
jgi:hypothetical protein